MPKKTFTPEQIVGKLRQIEVLWEPSTRRRFVVDSHILQRDVNVRLTGPVDQVRC